MIGKETDLIAFALARGVVIASADAAQLLTKATDYLNNQDWIGEPYDLTQVDAWPRFELVSPGGAFIDDNGSVIAVKRGEWVTDPVTPRAVIDAAYMLAMAVNDGVDLLAVQDGKDTIRETVGPITMEYAASTIGAGVTLPWWDKLLGAYIDGSGVSAGNFDVYRG